MYLGLYWPLARQCPDHAKRRQEQAGQVSDARANTLQLVAPSALRWHIRWRFPEPEEQCRKPGGWTGGTVRILRLFRKICFSPATCLARNLPTDTPERISLWSSSAKVTAIKCNQWIVFIPIYTHHSNDFDHYWTNAWVKLYTMYFNVLWCNMIIDYGYHTDISDVKLPYNHTIVVTTWFWIWFTYIYIYIFQLLWIL